MVVHKIDFAVGENVFQFFFLERVFNLIWFSVQKSGVRQQN